MRWQSLKQHDVEIAAALERLFVRQWVNSHGTRMTGECLWRALGFTSSRTFQHAARAQHLGIQLYPMPSGRGRFALTEDVARWVWMDLMRRKSGGLQ